MYRPPGQQPQPAQPQAQAQFKVLKALGRGSYGTVYKVQRLADGQVYAMKETDIGKMSQQERNDAVNEIRVLGSLRHPNVVRQYETFMTGNKLCIVMELAPAGDLAGFIRAAMTSGRPLPEGTIWQIFLQLCQGMQAVHDTCVIHRDIKPANIFMCPDNIVKVGDLGVAKALTRAHYAQTQIGTPVYMAPEVWRGLPYGYSSDLWSLGCVLYEMMSYKLPFDARSINELKNKVIGGRFPALVPGTYSPTLVGLCHALLSRDPRKRPTCAAILNSPEAAERMHTLPDAVRLPPPAVGGGAGGAGGPGGPGGPGGAGGVLMPTIRVPKDIRLLPGMLPKPAYEATLRAAMIGRAGKGPGGLEAIPQDAPLGAAPTAPSPQAQVQAHAQEAAAAAVQAALAAARAGVAAQRAPSRGSPADARAPSPRGQLRSPSPARAAVRVPSPIGGARSPSPLPARSPSPLLMPQPPAGAARVAGVPSRPHSGGRAVVAPVGAAGAARVAAVGGGGYHRPAAGLLPGGAAGHGAAAGYRPGGAYAPKQGAAAGGAPGGFLYPAGPAAARAAPVAAAPRAGWPYY